MSDIFISYRHEDDRGYAGRVHDTLRKHFREDSIFRDTGFTPGEKFETTIGVELDACRVFVAVIGRDWLDIRDKSGQRRLDNADDWVRRELSRALQRGILVIPLRVDNAPVPPESSLPPTSRHSLNTSSGHCLMDDGMRT